jgi:hypothetical protein
MTTTTINGVTFTHDNTIEMKSTKMEPRHVQGWFFVGYLQGKATLTGKIVTDWRAENTNDYPVYLSAKPRIKNLPNR